MRRKFWKSPSVRPPVSFVTFVVMNDCSPPAVRVVAVIERRPKKNVCSSARECSIPKCFASRSRSAPP